MEDPATKKRFPTVNRAQYTSVYDDINYTEALKHADSAQRELYEREAAEINEIQKGILAISQNEEPFDVFICYKETDEAGRRTHDSVLATDLYHQLTREGFKVFFSRITLEDKLGSAYEPYIFAALNSAKVMVVIGTRPEHFNAVWVKNEWSRYLSIIKNDPKKMLIPAYRDMDPYDMPEEFSHLQAQDMSKLGFMQDLIRGIRKIVAFEEDKHSSAPVASSGHVSSNVEALLMRGTIALEDEEWERADSFFEQILNAEATCAEAYLGKLMAELRVKNREQLANLEKPFDNGKSYAKVLRFASDELKKALDGYNETIRQRIENERLESVYADAVAEKNNASTQDQFEDAAALFDTIKDYKDSASLAAECRVKGEEAYKDSVLSEALSKMRGNTVFSYYNAMGILETIPGWKNSDELMEICGQKMTELEEKKRAEEEAERKRREKKAEEQRKKARKNKIIGISIASVFIIVGIAAFVIYGFVISSVKYNEAVRLADEGNYSEAITILEGISGYKDSEEKIVEYKAELKEIVDKWGEITLRETVSAGLFNTLALRTDGTVVAVGDNDYGQCNVSDWTDIVAVSAGWCHTVGLRSDGTVVAVGDNNSGQCDVSDWTDIVAVSAGWSHTVGLRADGTVVAVGANVNGQCNVSDWTDIVAVSAGARHTVGLRSDGTVVAVGYNEYGQCDVGDLTDIVAISAGGHLTVGLKSDGTVVAVGDNEYGQCDVDDWTDIVAVSAGGDHTVGLRSDGTVVAVGSDYYGQCYVSDWKYIVAVSAGADHTVGLRSDGTVVAVGHNVDDRCDVWDWTDIKIPEN